MTSATTSHQALAAAVDLLREWRAEVEDDLDAIEEMRAPAAPPLRRRLTAQIARIDRVLEIAAAMEVTS